MMDRPDLPHRLPPELANLDAELSALTYEERPSFAPELEAELAREWQSLQGRRYWPVRQLMAAAIAAVLLGGLGVPSARAALVRWMGSLVGTPPAEVLEPAAPTRLPAPLLDAYREEQPQVGFTPGQPPAMEDPTPSRAGDPDGLLGSTTFPEILDRARAEALIRGNYPVSFQRAGIGGTVGVLLWVDSTGVVDFVSLGRSSGVPELDRAALEVAPELRFEPARRRGQAVGTWVEFDVRFQTPDVEEGEDWLPAPGGSGLRSGGLDGAVSAEGLAGSALPIPGRLESGDLLRSVLGYDERVARLGPVAAILAGDPPAGWNPTAWRTEAAEVLEEAMVRAPASPAPYLALSRIRRKQGLREEAHALLREGLDRAGQGGVATHPRILADLHFDWGLLARERWVASRGLGRVPASALGAASCPRAPVEGSDASGFATVERLIAWNYLCPEELGVVLDRSFQSRDDEVASHRTTTQAAFRQALDADPMHRGAMREVLLALADEARWDDLLTAGRHFDAVVPGDPHTALLMGLALQRLSRTEEAEASFASAIGSLPADEADAILDVAPLLLEPDASTYRQLSHEARRVWREDFWKPLDPILATPVNERAVEHMARSSYALLRFGSPRSDPGEVWVRYGEPQQIRAFQDGTGVRTEFWDFGPGPDLTFRRLPDAPAAALTPEGRSYLDEVRSLVPHRYGNNSRRIYGLSAQVGLFRAGNDPRLSEIEMHTRVPLILATGAGDSLDVSLVVLGTAGDVLSATTERAPALVGGLSLAAPAPAPVGGVVVEVYSPRTGQAAALRRATPVESRSPGPSMSGLVLTVAASPSPTGIRRDAEWFEPLALDRPAEAQVIGGYVELYDMRGVAKGYRLRAEIVDRTNGDIRDIPIQPAGETGFRTNWERTPAEGAVTREFVSLWLADMPPGRYTVRLVADVPEAGVSVAAEQELDRR